MGGVKKELTKKELEGYRAKLLKMKEELLGEYKKLSQNARDDDGSNASSTSNTSLHIADAASDAYDKSLSLDLASNEMEIVSEIEHALRKIDDGTFGVCEGSGKPIPKTRLDAIPYVRYTRDYQQELEKNDPWSTGA